MNLNIRQNVWQSHSLYYDQMLTCTLYMCRTVGRQLKVIHVHFVLRKMYTMTMINNTYNVRNSDNKHDYT